MQFIYISQKQKFGCWLHLEQDLMRETKILGLLNKKNKNLNPEIALKLLLS